MGNQSRENLRIGAIDVVFKVSIFKFPEGCSYVMASVLECTANLINEHNCAHAE